MSIVTSVKRVMDSSFPASPQRVREASAVSASSSSPVDDVVMTGNDDMVMTGYQAGSPSPNTQAQAATGVHSHCEDLPLGALCKRTGGLIRDVPI